MNLSPPSYIEKAKIRGAKVTYAWKTKASKEYQREMTVASYEPVGKMSHHAALALGLGIAEWIAWRFDGLSDDKVLFQFIEKGWTFSKEGGSPPNFHGPKFGSPGYKEYANRQDHPVTGPLLYTQIELNELFSLFDIKSNGVYSQVVVLKWLAEVLVPSKSAFNTWYRKVIERFGRTYARPKTEKNFRGTPVPREALEG